MLAKGILRPGGSIEFQKVPIVGRGCGRLLLNVNFSLRHLEWTYPPGLEGAGAFLQRLHSPKRGLDANPRWWPSYGRG
jgi:hypothetical protein